MKIAIHQPNYLPNLGFFHKMNKADKFAVITNLQYERKEGWQRRHKIRMNGQDVWLTVPVKGSRRQLIKEALIENAQNWRLGHAESLRHAYGRSADPALMGKLTGIYEQEWTRLAELNFKIIETLKEILGIRCELVLDEETGGRKYELLGNVCAKHGADIYLSGAGGRDYMGAEYIDYLKGRGIACEFFEHNTTAAYPYSAVHYLFTEGPEWCRRVIGY